MTQKEWSDGYLRYGGETTRAVAVRVTEETMRRMKQKQKKKHGYIILCEGTGIFDIKAKFLRVV